MKIKFRTIENNPGNENGIYTSYVFAQARIPTVIKISNFELIPKSCT
ncbi:MAG: hypothetical protein ABII85_01365 [Bacillota bacterium]